MYAQLSLVEKDVLVLQVDGPKRQVNIKFQDTTSIEDILLQTWRAYAI